MCLMRIRATISFCLLTLSSCSEELIEFEEFRVGMSKPSIIQQFGEPLDMRKTAIMNYDAAFPIDEIPVGESPRTIVEVWNYPVLRTYGITDSTRRHETGQIELYFSNEQTMSNRVSAIGWLNQEHLKTMSSDSDT